MRASDFTKHIVEGLLGEDSKKDILAYAGSFRPPTKSDYNLLLKALEDNPGLDQIHVFVGDAESEGLDQDDAVKIWQFFGEHFPRDFYVHKSLQSPVSDVYAYASKYPTYDIDWLFGVREGNSDDFKQVADRTKSVNKYDNLSISPVVYDNKATEREVGAAANMGKDELAKYMPNNLTYKELDTIYKMLKPKQLKETIYGMVDPIIEKIVDEGWEYIEIEGDSASVANALYSKAKREKKKYFTLKYNRHTHGLRDTDNFLDIFWGDGEKEQGSYSRDIVENVTEQDIQDIKDAGELNLNEVVYEYSDDIINKIVEEGWEYFDTMGNLPSKAAKVQNKARVDKKKYFTLALERDSTSNPPESFMNIFWSDKGAGTQRDVIEGGTIHDYEDIKDAGELNLNEVVESDLTTFDMVIRKIVDGGFRQYQRGQKLTRFHRSTIIDDMKKTAEEEGVPGYFALSKFPNKALVHFSTGETFLFDDLSSPDIKDIEDAADAGKVNEIADKNLKRFDEVIEKIVEGGWKYVDMKDLQLKSKEYFLKRDSQKNNNKLFTIDFDIIYNKRGFLRIIWADKGNIDIEDFLGVIKQDIQDIEDAAEFNINEVANVDLAKWEGLINKIAEGDYEYYPATRLRTKSIDHPTTGIKNQLMLQSTQMKKPLFTYLEEVTGSDLGFNRQFESRSLDIYLARPDTTDVEVIRIHNTDQDDVETLQDLNEVSIKEAKNLSRFEKMLNKISEGDYYYVEALEHDDLRRIEMRQVRIEYNFDLDKPIFSYGIGEGNDSSNSDIVARFSDDGEDFWIIDATKQDIQDLNDTVEMFTSKIPVERLKESLGPLTDSVDEMSHYKDLMHYMSENGLNIKPYPAINFIDNDQDNAEDLLGKTAYYNPNDGTVTLYTYGRHPKDILRSFAHELVHVHQDNEGRIGNLQTTNTNEDDELVELEKEAYLKGNMMFRQWTDSLKENKRDYGIDAYSAELARLREGKEVKEFTETDFNRQRFYLDYFTNVSPSTFDVKLVEDDVVISGIDRPYPEGFTPDMIRQVPVNQALEENIDPKSQKAHKGKAAPYGSGYKKTLSEQAPTIDKIYCDINDVLAGTDKPEVDWTDDGRKLWEYLFLLRVPVTLLSSTTNQEQKQEWVKSAFHRQLMPKVIFRRSHDKHEFSEPGALLIDNKQPTIDSWEDKGGIGILHKNADDTIKQLQKLGM